MTTSMSSVPAALEPQLGAGDLPLFTMPTAGARDRRPGISGVTPESLVAWLAGRGLPAYRARQLSDQVWSGRAVSFEDVRTLPADVRAALEADFRLDTIVQTT